LSTEFETFKNKLLSLDPVWFCEKFLTLEGKPFSLSGNGYKPFADIYRYIAIKALENDSKPVIIVKGRQVGATTMASALEMYFMGCGLFGTGGKPPIRIMHCFPQLELAYAYSKTKLNPLISNSIMIETGKKTAKPKSYFQSILDPTSPTNDSLNFKQFIGGNHIWIESTGDTADRIRGRSADVMIFDECFPYKQCIETIDGKEQIGKLYDDFAAGKTLPLVKTFNEQTNEFEYKKINKVWLRGKRKLLQIKCGHIKIKCTPDHRFLTESGWLRTDQLTIGTLLKTSVGTNLHLRAVESIVALKKQENVYDIGVQDNHNFIICPDIKVKSLGGPIAHNCQDFLPAALGNATKILSQSRYGKSGDGVQVFFGTPKQRGSEFFEMWNQSSQQYYHLHCAGCDKFFPLYTPGSDEWEKTWITGFTVKCPFCDHLQDKRKAAESGKWVPLKDPAQCKFVGFHMSQLFIPTFQKEKILSEKSGIHPINTERVYMNEVLGEFFNGEVGVMTPEAIRAKCGDQRKFRGSIPQGSEECVVAGIDIGAKADMEQLLDSDKIKRQGQSYSCVVIMTVGSQGRLSIEYAWKFKRNDYASKKEFLDHIMRIYSVNIAVCDIGYTNDFSEIMQNEYGDRFLVSQASARVNEHIKYNKEIFPKTITFERDYYVAELYDQMKKGNIRFPYGDYDKIGWLIQHCSSMEIKPSLSRAGEVTPHYVKGSTPNDGFMALLNAYLAYKFWLTKGFTVKNPLLFNDPFSKQFSKQSSRPQVPAVLGYLPKMR